MPTNRAHKQHVRSQQRPGESYTAALRRLGNTAATPAGPDPIEWDEVGAGLGTTDFEAVIAGHTMSVSFAGSHRAPWTGWWTAFPVVDDENASTPEAATPAPVVGVGGRYRFPTSQPDAADIDDALAAVGAQLAAYLTDGTVPPVDATHGPFVAPNDVVDDGVYHLSVDATPAGGGDDCWDIVTLLDRSDYAPPISTDAAEGVEPGDTWVPKFAVVCDHDLVPSEHIRWAGDGWVDDQGRRVGLHQL